MGKQRDEQVCRSQVLVTGIDLEKKELRHYYNGSMRRVQKVTGPQTPVGRTGASESAAPPSEAGAFQGGEITFARGHIEICGQIVLRDAKAKLTRKMLEVLKARQSNGQFAALDGSELASRVQCEGGQNSVSSCIRDFRRTAARVLRAKLGLTVGPQDIIQSGGPGYRFNEWMTICDSTEAESSAA